MIKLVKVFGISKTTILLMPFTLILFQEVLVRLGLSFMGVYDEIVISCLLVYIIFDFFVKKTISKVDLFLLISLPAAVFISFLGEQQDKLKIIIQCFIHFKLLILYVGLRKVMCFNKQNDKSADFILMLWFFVSLIGFLFNVFLQERFYDLLNAAIKERGGALRIEGFQLKPNDLALFLAYFYIYIVLAKYKNMPTVKFILWTVVVTVMILMNGSRTALVAIFLTMTVYFFKNKIYIIFIVPLLPLCAVFLWGNEKIVFLLDETIKNIGEFQNIDQSMYIRGIMIFYGFILAFKYFPIGAGAATFGSVMSVDSPVYDMLGLSTLRFFEDMEGVFDSNLGTVLGEFGFLGLAWFFLMIKVLFKDAKMLSENKNEFNRFAIVLVAYSLFVFITNPLLMYQYNGLVFSFVLLAGAKILRTR